MPNSDDQHRLNARQRREIDQIGQKFHFNLAPPPSSLDEITTGRKFVSLTDFIEQLIGSIRIWISSTGARSNIWLRTIFGPISVNLRCRWESLATFRR